LLPVTDQFSVTDVIVWPISCVAPPVSGFRFFGPFFGGFVYHFCLALSFLWFVFCCLRPGELHAV